MNAALQRTFAHQQGVAATLSADPFEAFSPAGSPLDAAAAGKAVGRYLDGADQTAAVIAADRGLVRAARDQLDPDAFATAPFRSELERQQRRADHALQALEAADRELEVGRREAGFLRALVDFLGDLEAMNRLAIAKDGDRALALYPELEQKLLRADAAAHDSELPPQLRELTANLTRLLQDVKGALQAARARDAAAADRFSAAAAADLKAVSTFDARAANDFRRRLVQPLEDAYNSNLEQARAG
jgi:hypothetical protein